MSQVEPYRPQHKIRFVSAAALFDGHDAAINVMRRIMQASGAEVIHLGHNRGAAEVVDAAIQEDAQAIAVSSYQGGHMELFRYIVDLLREHDAAHIRVFGGGGGVIVPDEIRELEAHGVTKIFSPEDGLEMGLQGMINLTLEQSDFSTLEVDPIGDATVDWQTPKWVARALTRCELHRERVAAAREASAAGGEGVTTVVAGDGEALEGVRFAADPDRDVPVVGLTGTGGA
ncbi:MAG: cobalamin-dependent protein, partial [Candidatus Eiseniibacteriota bacterium]